MFILILISSPILRFLILDNTYVPADQNQGMGYQERHDIELKECPNCGLKVDASKFSCTIYGNDLNENALVPDKGTVSPIDTASQLDPLSDDGEYAPNPDHFESDEIDRRSAVFVMGILLSLTALALIIYSIIN